VRTWQHIAPATNEPDFHLACADDVAIDRAVRAARRAFDEGPWPRLHAMERRRMLRPIVDLIEAHADTLHHLHRSTPCPPIGPGSAFRYSATIAADLFDITSGGSTSCLAKRRPSQRSGERPDPDAQGAIGVVAAINAFNAPVMQFAVKVAPALAAGCTLVLKPSEYASNVSHFFARLIEQLDLPPGVFNLVPGDGGHGRRLGRASPCRQGRFTGRHGVGRDIIDAGRPQSYARPARAWRQESEPGLSRRARSGSDRTLRDEFG
jgi:aldehyde dehydrogenase (NAD+)